MRPTLPLIAVALLVAGCAAAPKAPDAAPASSGVIGVRESHLDPEYWVKRAPDADRIVLDRTQIAAQNDRLAQLDPSVRDIERLPPQLTEASIKEWIENLSSRPSGPLYDASGGEISELQLQAVEANTDLKAIRAQPTRYGMVVHRADLRTFPTRLRVFKSPGDADIDRFQESALFPGAPVAIVHESADRAWWFVVSNTYAAWIEKQHVAEGAAPTIFGYARKTPYVVVTGATAQTVFTPERPEVSQLQLDMGVRAPVLSEWPADKPVNGQHPYAAHVIELPVRRTDGTLELAPALLPKTADVEADYLPLNRASLLRQSFKFLGERYGWGHSYNARDCSGFVSEVYRGFGVSLPRNTRDQAVSPALKRVALTPDDDYAKRLALLAELQVGDLIYIPGHVMMVIGQEGDAPYVIHDTTGINYRDANGEITRADLNGVSVTPLAPLLSSNGRPLVDAIHSIVKIRP